MTNLVKFEVVGWSRKVLSWIFKMQNNLVIFAKKSLGTLFNII
jgi:hypothetical protein